MTIWKFPLTETDLQIIPMPENSEILSVQVQPKKAWGCDTVCIWALVDPEAPKRNRQFRIYPTGATIPYWAHGEKHIGTVQIDGYVFHIFEQLEEGQRQ